MCPIPGLPADEVQPVEARPGHAHPGHPAHRVRGPLPGCEPRLRHQRLPQRPHVAAAAARAACHLRIHGIPATHGRVRQRQVGLISNKNP